MTISRRVTTVVGLALALALALGLSSGASAAEHQVVRGRHLELVSVLPDGADRLSPGVTVDWMVGISAPGAQGRPADSGTIERAVLVSGDLAQHLHVSVASCTGPATEDCTDSTTLVPSGPVSAGQQLDLGSQPADEQQWLLVQVSLPRDVPAAAQAHTASLHLVARGAGEELTVIPGGEGAGGEEPTEVASSGQPAEAAPVDGPSDEPTPPVAWLPGTGAQPALLLLAAGSAALVGAALRSQHRTQRAQQEREGRSRS